MKGLGVDILNGFGSIVVSFQLVFGLSDHDEDRSVPQILGGWLYAYLLAQIVRMEISPFLWEI